MKIFIYNFILFDFYSLQYNVIIVLLNKIKKYKGKRKKKKL